jgi:hypothetical protein
MIGFHKDKYVSGECSETCNKENRWTLRGDQGPFFTCNREVIVYNTGMNTGRLMGQRPFWPDWFHAPMIVEALCYWMCILCIMKSKEDAH